MARLLAQTSQTLIRNPSSPLRSRLLGVRSLSGLPEDAQVVEIEAEVSSGSGGEVEVHIGMHRLEDAIHSILVRRAAPEWLPFIPGSSYWVPPRSKSLGLVELVSGLADPMTEEEALSFTSVRGWPSLAYFVDGVPPPHPLKARHTKSKVAQSDDEE